MAELLQYTDVWHSGQ